MTKREIWRAKAARYLRWHRSAMRARFITDYARHMCWHRMYCEARQYADYWECQGEQARAPSWYYPD